jgi:hypothetical protein
MLAYASYVISRVLAHDHALPRMSLYSLSRTHITHTQRAVARPCPRSRRVLPSWWSDNYVSILPGERRVLTAECCALPGFGEPPLAVPSLVLEVDGFNVESVSVSMATAED